MFIYAGIFFVLTILFSSFGKDSNTGFQTTKINVGIVDHDKSTASKALKTFLSNEQNVKDIKDEKKTMQNELFYRNTEYILILPKGFGESLLSQNKKVQIENVKVPGSTSGYMIDEQVNKFTKMVGAIWPQGFQNSRRWRGLKIH